MEGKTIKNIVFYTLSTEKGLTKKAAIFYSDGSIEDTTYDAGIDACEQVAKERNIQSKDAFREMINQDIIHVMSGEEFARRFASFIPEQRPARRPRRTLQYLRQPRVSKTEPHLLRTEGKQ